MKQNLNNKADYNQALNAVKEVIHAWDPYGLLAGGAPSDEFDPEIAKLVTKVRTISTEEDAVRSIEEVFADFLGDDGSKMEYKIIGKKLFENLLNHKVIELG